MDVRVGLSRKLSAEELMLLNYVLDKALESPLDCKESQPVHPKGDQSWIIIGRTDAEAETPIVWPPDMKNWLIGKDCDAGKDWRWEEKGMTEDEMVGVIDSMHMSLSKLQELVMDREACVLQFMGSQRVRQDWVTELNWTECSKYFNHIYKGSKKYLT